jgi:hypothetical protein
MAQRLRESRYFVIHFYQFCASIPFIRPCSVGLSPRAGSLLSPTCLLHARRRIVTSLSIEQHMKCPSTLLLGFTGFKGRADRTSTSFPVPNTFPSLPGPCSFVRLSGEWKRGRNPVGTGRRKAEGIRTSPRFTVHAVSSGDGSLLYREHAYLRKFNYEAKTWNGRSRDQGVSILPFVQI